MHGLVRAALAADSVLVARYSMTRGGNSATVDCVRGRGRARTRCSSRTT